MTIAMTIKWEEVGFWQAGTVVGVALEKREHGRGVLASRAGVYGWQKPGAALQPLIKGMSDLQAVTVTLAGGDAAGAATVVAATATGRLFRLSWAEDKADQAWHEIPSWAGLGVAVVLEPSPTYAQDGTLFAGTEAGIFRTLDGGQSWESCNFGLLDEDVLCMACAPDFAESELLWAGTAGGGFYRSRNSGRAWRESGIGLPDAAVQALVVSPDYSQDRTLFVGMEEQGVFVSHDRGENWQSLGLAGQSVNSLACAAADQLWAGTEDGLWLIEASNGEATLVAAAGEVVLSVAAIGQGTVAAGLLGRGLWFAEGGADDPTTMAWNRPELALHAPPVIAAQGGELFALDSDGYVAHSLDGGAQWLEMESESAERVLAMGTGMAAAGSISGPWEGQSLLRAEFAPDNPSEVIALSAQATTTGHFAVNVWHSTDLGGSWEVLANFSSGVRAVMMAWPVDATERAIFLSTQHRVLKLYQDAETAELQVYQHFFDEHLSVTALISAPDYAESHTIWAATTGGVYRSVDCGLNWEPILHLPLELPIVWLDATSTSLTAITLGARVWRASL